MDPQKLQEGTVVIDVTLHRPGDSRRINLKANTAANETWLKHSKRIFKSDLYNRCCRVQDGVKTWLKARSLPVGLHGCYAVPLAILPDALDMIDQAQAELTEAVEAFAAERERIEAEANEQLKDLFRKGQIPTAAYIRWKFAIETCMVELGVPGEGKLTAALSARAREEAKRYWEAAAQDVSRCLWEQFQELVARLADKLEPNPDGSRKQLHEGAVTKLVEWLELFGKRNVLGDDQLAELVKRSRLLLNGRDAEVLRDNARLREKVGAEFQRVASAAAEQIGKMPKRRITFDEE